MINKQIFSLLVLSTIILVGCQNKSEQPSSQQTNSTATTSKLPTGNKIPQCKKPAPVHDIWKLEPLLIKSGEITSDMTQEEKEKAIKAFIARKNAQYQTCLKRKP